MKQQQSGYILMLTLMMITLMTFVATYLVYLTTGYGPAMRAFVDRQKASSLALGGIQLAVSQLAVYPQNKDQGAQTKAATQPVSKDQEAVTLLKKIMPQLNRWQTYSLKKSTDGVNGTVQICIMCENGKININSLYDFNKHKFIQDNRDNNIPDTLQSIFEHIKKRIGGENLFKPFEKFLKDRQYKLDDVTELLTIKEFEVFKKKVWYEPTVNNQSNLQKESEKRPVYLTDIFTVWTNKPDVNPWLLSDSLCALLDCKRAQGSVIESDVLNAVLKQFKINAAWATDWNKLLKPVYEKEYSMMPSSITKYFSPTFEATIFSVLSYAKVGTITQKLLAIIERSASEAKNGQAHVDIKIRKIYWL